MPTPSEIEEELLEQQDEEEGMESTDFDEQYEWAEDLERAKQKDRLSRQNAESGEGQDKSKDRQGFVDKKKDQLKKKLGDKIKKSAEEGNKTAQKALKAREKFLKGREKLQKVLNAKEAAKKAVKKAVKQAGKAVARSIGQAIIATAPYWGPILLGIIAIIVLIFVIIVAVKKECDESYTIQFASKTLSWTGIIPADVCKELSFLDELSISSSGISPDEPVDLIDLRGIVNVDTSQASDPRVRECMAGKLRELFRRAENAGLLITVTSAYRAGELTASGDISAHSRGEAVDIVILNPRVPWPLGSGNYPQIGRLVEIAKSVGFVPPEGDTLDEYHYPAPNATGGHVHVEFNIPSSGSYCD